MNTSSVRVVRGKDAPQMVRDEEPFFAERWKDVETGNEYVNEYRLVFNFQEGLLVEITQKLEGCISAFSWEVPPNQLGIEAQARLKNSESINRIRSKVKEIVQGMTVNFTIMLERLAEMNSMSLEYLRSKYKEVVQRLTENLDALFFDPVGGWRWIACYVCGSDTLHECIRCSRDICNQHAVFAETEVGEPLIYCHECFWEAVEE